MYTYKALIIRVIDGDTVKAELDLGFGIKKTDIFRIDYDSFSGTFNTPETFRPKTEYDRVWGEQATKKAKELLTKPVIITTSKSRPGIYGRYTCSIRLNDGKDYAAVMTLAGFQKNKKDEKKR